MNIKNQISKIKYKVVLVLAALFLSPFTFHLSPLYASLSMQDLGDSLFVWTGFSRVWSPTVRVKQMRVNGNNVTLQTNVTLRDVRWTPENIKEVKRNVSRWVLGHENGNVTIYSARTDIESLITPCAKNQKSTIKNQQSDLTDRSIALWPSHGLYFNRDRQEWIWQRAALWTTVEDLYSQEYVRLVKRMLENAGATVLMPRAGLDEQQLGPSGMPRWSEGARYWLIEQGADSTLWDLYEGDEYKDDMKCRAMWVNSLQTPVDLCLALHTDGLDSGNDSTIIGTLVIYTAKDDENRTQLRDGRDREKTNRNLADWIQTSITNDLRTIAPQWTRRQLKESNYCESRVPVVPSVLLEILSHKNLADMQYGLDPHFRFTAARAIYKGMLRYLNGPQAVVQPLPVQDLGIQITNQQSQIINAELSWIAPVDSLELSAKPSYYMVYIQENDGEWNVQQVENATSLTLTLQPGIQYNYYVVAGNEGGLSFPSPTVSAYLTAESGLTSNSEAVLIIDAFNDVYGPDWFIDSTFAGIVPGSYACEDRFSCAYIGQQWDFNRAHPWVNDDNCGFGACHRDHAGQFTVGNTRDYAALHGRVLRKMHLSYVSCTPGMISNIKYQISNIKLIDVICGRQRNPLDDTLQALLANHLDNNGSLLLSTDHFSALNPLWAKRYLHASFRAANATHSGRIAGARHRLYQLLLEPNEEQLFSPNPEALKPEKEGETWATYEDLRCPAAIGYKSPISNLQSPMTLVFAFPLEAVQDFDRIYKHAIQWLIEQERGTE